jgi:hypothetical protein
MSESALTAVQEHDDINQLIAVKNAVKVLARTQQLLRLRLRL